MLTSFFSLQLVAASVYTLSPGRIGAMLAGVIELIGVIAGARALARGARRGAIAALALGPIALVVGMTVVATAKGGLGTGNGLGGGVVAIVIGLIGMTLGALALSRARRTE